MANVDPQTIATFNDATRALVGGLWSTAVEEGNQGFRNSLQF
jgi:hypothetical protein